MHKIDAYDLKILGILARNGRITKSRLAEMVNLSVTPTWERVRKLEAAGIIRGYRASVDWTAVFKSSQILIGITLARHTAQDMQRFEQRMTDAPEVSFCYATGGGIDYIVMVRSQDIDQYQRFVDQLLAENLRIERYFTYIVTKTVKEGEAAYLPDS